MSGCCGDNKQTRPTPSDPCAPPDATVTGCATHAPALKHFAQMVPNALAYAQAAKAAGRPVMGIMCEFTPRELILAADGVPVCLCGGSAKMIPAAEEHLPANLCPLIKSTYGYHLRGANPFLEMADLLVAETTCDGKKKVYELLGQQRPMHVLELPQKPDDPAAFEHWVEELRRLRVELERRFERPITDGKLRESIRLMNRERQLRRDLAGLLKEPAPALTGRQLLELKSLISGIPADLEQYEAALRFFRAAPPVPNAARRPRVLLTGVPLAHGAERVLELIEDAGGLVVCQENCTGLKPLLDDVSEDGDPLRAIAAKYFHLPCSVMTPNRRRFESLRRLVQEYRPQCIIELIWQACLTYDVESAQVRQFARELNLPYLKIETGYSPADSARIQVRVQALFETLSGCGRP